MGQSTLKVPARKRRGRASVFTWFPSDSLFRLQIGRQFWAPPSTAPAFWIVFWPLLWLYWLKKKASRARRHWSIYSQTHLPAHPPVKWNWQWSARLQTPCNKQNLKRKKRSSFFLNFTPPSGSPCVCLCMSVSLPLFKKKKKKTCIKQQTVSLSYLKAEDKAVTCQGAHFRGLFSSAISLPNPTPTPQKKNLFLFLCVLASFGEAQ